MKGILLAMGRFMGIAAIVAAAVVGYKIYQSKSSRNEEQTPQE